MKTSDIARGVTEQGARNTSVEQGYDQGQSRRTAGSRRFVPSGCYRIDVRRPEPGGAVQALLNAKRTAPAHEPQLPQPPAQCAGARRVLGAERVDQLMPLVLVAGVAAHWFLHSELGLTLLSLTPLLVVLLKRGTPKGYIYAGFLSLLFGASELVHPLNLPSPAHMFGVPPHRVVSLLVMALVLVRLRAAYSGLQELSRRDPLTGLLNRRGFDELATREFHRAVRYARPIAFALVDVDRFKQINDRFGHAHGDRVLQAVAAHLAELRNSDLCVRLGGDEFGLLMPETDEAAAEQVVARLKHRLHEYTRALDWTVTVSVGIAANDSGAPHSLATLMAEADSRMYLCKPPSRADEPATSELRTPAAEF